MDLPDAEPDMFALWETTALVTGVGFEPGKSEVRLLADGRSVTCSATESQVEGAYALRHKDIRVLLLMGPKPRLLWLRDADVPRPEVSAEQRREQLFARWGNLLRRLA